MTSSVKSQPQRCSFRTLNVNWSLEADNSLLVSQMANLYELFKHKPMPREGPSLTFSVNGLNINLPNRGLRQLLPEPLTLPHLHMLVLNHVHDQLANHLLLHAAAVAQGDQAIAICGLSGYGKTTLAEGLTNSGWTLLSDEFAALESSTGTLWPYPRLPGCCQRPDPGWWSIPVFWGKLKWYPPAGSLAKSFGCKPIPLKAVVVLTHGFNQVTCNSADLVVALRTPGTQNFLQTLRQWGAPQPYLVKQGVAMTRLLFKGAGINATLAACERNGDSLIYAEKVFPALHPDTWQRIPCLTKLAGNQSILKVLPFVRNRHYNPAQQKSANRAGSLLLQLAQILKSVPIFQLTIGRLDESLTLLRSLTR